MEARTPSADELVVIRSNTMAQFFGYLYVVAGLACIPVGALALRERNGGGIAALIVVYVLGALALGGGLDAVTNQVIANSSGITYRSWLRNNTYSWDDIVALTVERRGRWDARQVVRLRTKARTKPIPLLCVGSYRPAEKRAHVEALLATRPMTS